MTDAENALAKQRFIECFAQHGVVAKACREAKIGRQTFYSWKRRDPAFVSALEDALEESNDAIRAEIHRRAVEGWEEPVYQRGALVGEIRKYSDALLIKMATARLEEYRALTEKYAPKQDAESEAASRKVEVTIREVSDWDSVTRNRS